MTRRICFLCACIALLVGSVPAEEPAPPAAVPAPIPVHQPGAQLEQAVTDVVLACLREDAAAAFEAMERLDGACRKLSAKEDPTLSHGIIVYDQALHTALERSRGLVRTKHVTEAFDQFVWVMRACRQCHEMARRDGKGPLAGSDAPADPAKKPAESRLR